MKKARRLARAFHVRASPHGPTNAGWAFKNTGRPVCQHYKKARELARAGPRHTTFGTSLDCRVQLRGSMCHFLSIAYHSVTLYKQKKIRGQFLGFYCDFSKNDLFGHIFVNYQIYSKSISRTKDLRIRFKIVGMLTGYSTKLNISWTSLYNFFFLI